MMLVMQQYMLIMAWFANVNSLNGDIMVCVNWMC